MAYFPFFTDIAGRRGLIVGGGKTALGKARRLLEYGPELTVVAPEILPALSALPVSVYYREYSPMDLRENIFFVIAATDDMPLNHSISLHCREMRIPVNVVDAPEDCTFLFPSLLRRGPLTIGVSTGGTSPTAARAIRAEIERSLPENIGDILAYLGDCRGEVISRLPSEEARKRVFQTLFTECVAMGRPLTAAETAQILAEEAQP